MHLSALESLSSLERTEYDRKRAALQREYEAQLGDFETQEMDALLRHKARIRSSSERKLDELLEAVDKQHKLRTAQTTKANAHMLQQVQRDHEESLRELKKKLSAELYEEQERLRHEKDGRLDKVSREVEQEQDAFEKRLRDEKQTKRTEELVADRRVEPGRIELKSASVHHKKMKWERQIQQEHQLLSKARAMLRTHKQDVKRQGSHVTHLKAQWRRDMSDYQTSGGEPNHDSYQVLQHMRKSIDHQARMFNTSVAQIRATEKWIQRRQRKVRHLEKAADELENNVPDDEESISDSVLSTLEQLSEELEMDASEVSSESSVGDPVLLSPVAPRLSYEEPLVHHLGFPSSFRHQPDSIENFWMMQARPPTDRIYPVLPHMRNSSVSIYQKQINQWAQGRQKVQRAALKHASWLGELCRELRSYGQKYGEPRVVEQSG